MARLTRRQLIKRGLAAAGIGTIAAPFYLFNEPMLPAPIRRGKVLCDLHAHPGTYAQRESILEVLGSPGLIGLARRPKSRTILDYETAVEMLRYEKGFREITSGQLFAYRNGYGARTEEFTAGIHHMLAVGFEGSYFQDQTDAEKAVQEIHRRNGTSRLCHPMVLEGRARFRLADADDRKKIREMYPQVTDVETGNAYCINMVPVIGWMQQANDIAECMAKEVSKESGRSIIETESSDAHRRLDQCKLRGIYIDEKVIEEQGIEGLKSAIRTGKFERFGDSNGPYVSRWSFIKGMFGEIAD